MKITLVDSIQQIFISSNNVIIKLGAVTGNTDQSETDILSTTEALALPIEKFRALVKDLNKAEEALFSSPLPDDECKVEREKKETLGLGVTIKK